MDKETYRISVNKIKALKQVLWKELSRETKKRQDVLKATRLLEMYERIDTLECEFQDWLEPEQKVKKK